MKILAVLAVLAAGLFTSAWLWMLLIGVIHHEWLPMMPTVGYTGALRISLMSFALGGVAGVINAWVKGLLDR